MEDEARDGGSGSSGGTGSVAHEAALLIELLSARGWRGGAASGDAPGPEPAGARAEDSTCTCGGSVPQACRVCPVCQLIAFVQQVSPDTIERVAEVVDLAAAGLRDLAQAQRARRTAAAATPAGTEAPEEQT